MFKSNMKNSKAFNLQGWILSINFLKHRHTNKLHRLIPIHISAFVVVVVVIFTLIVNQRRVWKFFALSKGHWAEKVEKYGTRWDRHNLVGQTPLPNSGDAVFLHIDLNDV